MGNVRRISSRLVPSFRYAASWNRKSCVCDGAFAGSHQLSTLGSSAGRWNEDENSSSSTQVLNHQVSQQKTLRTLLSRNVAANCARDKWRSLHRSNYYSPTRRNVDVPRCLVLNARLDGFDDRTRPRTWLGQRYFSSDSETKRKGLQESQIGQELLSAAQEGSSTGLSGASQGLQLASGEVLSPEEEAALKLAETEFENRKEQVSVESIQEMLKELSSVADPKDPRIAIVSLRLGQEYEARGENPKTFMKLGEQALSIFKTAGEFTLEIGMCHHLIALAHHRLGQYEKSLENLNKAISLLKDNEGKESGPIKFALQFLMGDTLSALGKHDIALKHYIEGLAVQETILDAGHPQLASNYRQVGEAFTQVMMFEEAKDLVEKALKAHIKNNGKGSIEEAIDRRLLSVIYSGLEEHEKALEEQQNVRSILNARGLGSEARFVEIAIADTQLTLGRLDDAIATLQDVISHLEEGNSLRDLATVNLAKAYTQQGNEEKAAEHSRAARSVLDSKLHRLSGGDTELLTVGECYTELAAIHQRMKRPEEAVDLLKKALSIYKQLPQQMNAAAGSQAQIGLLLYFSGKVEEAIPYMEEAAANLRHSYGNDHFSLALVLNHLAVANVKLENREKAIELFEESKRILTQTHGPGQQDTLAVYYNLMQVYATLGRKEKAIENAKHIVVELEKHGEPAKAALAEAQKDLASLEQSDSTSLQESGQQLLETMKLPGSD
ncbi:protein KINESIN LIGHT CHAIN-RELATED 3 isoform X2 [Physcomitrium patens]|uniref:MalT-like TPR region domain-containing protein n=1 Tax=Physcomitrium patens TaxID=3218 RepID=A0A7I4F9V1_PHYPA|nr:protein KINESIN LIGHT CHAIN-RELATED 3-like isoform X2 [Physcomitrium patens]|eukprot:XP_024403334.1 protein KINESIN LIGHT CHAIN-RELATED 3-like isoform X2 [Physcomitrella patens]